jgi:hypothetical protein
MDISKAKITVAQKSFTGSPVTLTADDIEVKLGDVVVPSSAYTLEYEKEEAQRVNTGTYKVTVKGKSESGYGNSKTVSFKVVARSMDYTVHYDKNDANLLAALSGKYETSELENFSIAGTMNPSMTERGGKLAKNGFTVKMKTTKNDKVKLVNASDVTFAGWNTKPDGKGVSFGDQAVFSPKLVEKCGAVCGDDITLYAQWSVN